MLTPSYDRAFVLGVLALLAPKCYGAGVAVELAGVSATQAILRYQPPNNSPCKVEVSEANTFQPLVHDVDPALFARILAE